MKFSSHALKKVGLLAIPFWQTENKAVLACKEVFGKESWLPIELGDFKGKEGETSLIYQEPDGRIVLLGLGPKDKASTETLRRSYAALGKLCLSKKVNRFNLSPPSHSELSAQSVIRGIAEGLMHVNYIFDKYKTSNPKDQLTLIEEIGLLSASREAVNYIKRIEGIFEGVNIAKTLVNSNADEVTPQYLSDLAMSFEKKFPRVKTRVLNKKQIQKEGLGLLLAVNKGSSREPVLIEMKYSGISSKKEHTVIVGKGITYDTGGLNLKPTGSMETMKCDMAGAAAGFGLIAAASNIGLKANFTVLIPSTENMIDANSFKPGDVFMSALGKSVEIDNTDAEGRLILADAFAYANKHLSPSRMIDLSTLTGGIVIALGEEVTGIMGNDQELIEGLKQAGEVTFERLWQLPLYDEYKDQLKSDIADIKNAGGRQASSITAALFLKEFVGTTPWAHLDIAGTAYLSKERRYFAKNATGVGVRLLIEFLENY